MKKILSLLLVSGAILMASCTTDATKDIGVDAVGKNLTTITLSLEQSRTQLGEKAGELYPLLWSEGDQISINGVASTALSASEAGAASATFSVAGSLQKPYCIAYPAAAAGQVLFADKQAHASNTTFGSGVSTMYAYTEDGLGVQLNHLTGVLKIGVVGSAKLVLAQISTVDRKPIAGAFDFDFEKGEATATASSKELIEYSFGEGVQLSSEPTYIHAVVPAGEYDELYVTLYDEEGGVMYATVKANEEKPLAAGKVREFSTNINYAATTSVFVVRDVASLKSFAEQAATLEKDVLFVADVDLTGEAWTPIEGYAGTINGNGYAIKGLTAPLFGTTNASIKGLHLRDVAIVTNDDPISAALARTVTANETTIPEISHCSVSGSLIVENPTFAAAGANSGNELVYAGLIARSFGAKVDNCVNNVSVTINNLTKPGDTASIYGFYAGVVGWSVEHTRADSSKIFNDITNCVNNGAILLQDESVPDGVTTRAAYIGGIVSRSGDANEAKLSGNTNNGTITVTSPTLNSGGRSIVGGIIARGRHFSEFNNNVNSANGKITIGPITNVYLGGIIGYSNNVAGEFLAKLWSASNCHNHADITLESNNYSSIHVGGIAGSIIYWDFTHCDNTGNISVKTTAATSKTDYNVAGWAGQYTGDSGDARQPRPYYLTNSGTVTVDLFDATMSTTLRVAGLIAYSHAAIRNSTTYKSAKVTLKGKIHQTVKAATFTDDSSETQVTIGGLGGYLASTASYNCTVENDVEVDATWTGTNASYVQIGGMVGRTHNKVYTSTHTGNVTVNGDFSTVYTHIGGCAGITYWNNKDFVNEGKVTVTGSYGHLSVGGVTGSANHGADLLVNKGDVYVDATYNGQTHIAGCVAYSVYDDKSAKACTNCDNYGKVTVLGDYKYESTELRVAGVACNVSTKTNANTNLHNHETGDIYINLATNVGKIQAGGVMVKSKAALTNSTNRGDITILGKAGNTVYVGGVLAVQNGYERTDLANYGKITIGANINGGSCFVGGICYDGQYSKVWTRCHNHGDIEFTKEFTNTGNVRCGGILGKFETDGHYAILDGCSNSGDITFLGHSDSYVRLGGMVGCHRAGSIVVVRNGFTNSGNITYSGDVAGADNVHIGGLIGCPSGTCKFALSSTTTDESGATVTSEEEGWSGTVVNTGTVTLTGSTDGGMLRAGGFFGLLETAENPFHHGAKFYQLGDIVFAGDVGAKNGVAGTSQIGGVVSYSVAPVNNVECYCKIDAPTATSIGFIMPTPRVPGSVIATNCKIGGTLVGDYDEDEDVYIETKLSSSNFHNYLFGSGKNTDWTGTDNYDGCSYLSSKPTIQ
ncbi:MAG: hypothetical protein IKA07_02255 [Alistipes sp.]|nr:hypothetical protein [Alistipes sp.]